MFLAPNLFTITALRIRFKNMYSYVSHILYGWEWKKCIVDSAFGVTLGPAIASYPTEVKGVEVPLVITRGF